MANYLVDGTTNEEELKLLRAEFEESIYPSLRNLTEGSLEIKFKDGTKNDNGDYEERALIVAPIFL